MKIAGLILITFYCLALGACADEDNLGQLNKQLKAEDERLNVAYKAVMAACDEQHQECLRQAERTWIKYRDALADVEARRVSEQSGRDKIVRLKTLLRETQSQTRHLEVSQEEQRQRDERRMPEAGARSLPSVSDAREKVKEWHEKHPLKYEDQVFDKWVMDVEPVDQEPVERLRNVVVEYLDNRTIADLAVFSGSRGEDSYVEALEGIGPLLEPLPPAEFMSPIEYKISESAEIQPMDEFGIKATNTSYIMKVKGIKEPIDIGSKEEHEYKEGGHSTDGFDGGGAKWLIPAKILWVYTEENMSGTGAITVQNDTFYETKDGKAVEKFVSSIQQYCKNGAGCYYFGKRAFRWDKATDCLVEITLNRVNHHCQPTDFLAKIDSSCGEYWRDLRLLSKKVFDLSTDDDSRKRKPVKVIGALEMQDTKAPPESIASYVALLSHDKVYSLDDVQGKATPVETQKALEKLKQLNPELSAKKEWSGVVYVPSSLDVLNVDE